MRGVNYEYTYMVGLGAQESSISTKNRKDDEDGN